MHLQPVGVPVPTDVQQLPGAPGIYHLMYCLLFLPADALNELFSLVSNLVAGDGLVGAAADVQPVYQLLGRLKSESRVRRLAA